MRRETARQIHTAANISYWLENPQWNPGDNRLLQLGCSAMRALPFSVHEAQKKAFFDLEPEQLVAINGESVVVKNGKDNVDKFMFRYPGDMGLGRFRKNVADEIAAVTECMPSTAHPTEVSIKTADFFRPTLGTVKAVAQSQVWLGGRFKPLNLDHVKSSTPRIREGAARSLDTLLTEAKALVAEHGYYADVANDSGNVQLDLGNGSVTLVDVMPYYANGNRLIDDSPVNVVANIQQSMQTYEEFVGQYGG